MDGDLAICCVLMDAVVGNVREVDIPLCVGGWAFCEFEAVGYFFDCSANRNGLDKGAEDYCCKDLSIMSSLRMQVSKI